jgi:hypothetical protein
MECMEQIAREARTELGGTLRYGYGAPEDTGVAQWVDVSRSGAAIQLGRYLRPGREITLEVNSPLAMNGAGLLVYRDTPEMALDFAALGYAARRQQNTTTSGEVSKKPLWNLFPQREESGNLGGFAQARAV